MQIAKKSSANGTDAGMAKYFFLGRFSCHGRKHSQTMFTTEDPIKILAASTCKVDFF